MTDATIDPAVLALAQKGDPDAMERVLERLAPTLQRFARRLCGDSPDVDDTVQDALLQIARKLSEFEGRSSLTSWSYAVARSACSHRRRGLKNRPPVADDAAEQRVADEPSPEAVATEAELSKVLREVLDGLPEDYREVLVLRDVEGLTAPETADAIGLSVDAVKSRLHRARGALREAMKPWLEPPPPDAAPSACPDVAVMLSRKIEGELTQEDCAAMERHVESCPQCKGACSALSRALSACARTKGEGPVPDSVQASVRRALRAWLAG
jgi:RNA polymerase sigma-70 factor (ECF subfamily)